MKDLFDPIAPVAHARRSDPHTSHEAAAGVSHKLTDIQQQVLLLFKVRGRMTDLDLQEAFGFSGSTHRTRRCELVDKGLLRDSGIRKMQNGSNRIVWELVN